MPKGNRTNHKPNAGSFQKGAAKDDPRRNNAGQRNAAAVATAAQLRELYVQLLNQMINEPLPIEMSNLELIARQHLKAAKQGNSDEREKMLDRIWGKATQAVDLISSDGSMTPKAVMFVPYDGTDTDNS